MLILLSWNTAAQPSYNGKHIYLQTTSRDKEITWCDQSHYIVTYFHKASASGIRHHFIVQDMTTNNAKQFSLDAYYSSAFVLHSTTITINDMKIDGNGECWFCGKKSTETEAIYYPGIGWMYETDDYGIVGHFSLYDVISGSGNYELFTIYGTGGLTRIEPRGNYGQVFMVGYPYGCTFDASGNPTASCLVGLGYNSFTAQWKYDIVHPSDPNELFTDVTDAGAGIAVVSRFKNDHYHIGLRHTKKGMLGTPNLFSFLYNINIYDMQLATTGSGTPVAWRKDADPVFLAAGNYGSALSLAYSCNNIANGIASFELAVPNIGDVQITAAKHIISYSYLELIDCKAYSNNFATDFLIYDNSSNQYGISSIDWLSGSTSFTGASCSESDYIWQSITSYDSISSNGNNTYSFRYIAGHKPDNTPVFTKYHSLPVISKCIDNTTYSIQNLTIPTTSPVVKMVYLDGTYNNYPTTPINGSFSSTIVYQNALCTF